MLLIQNIMIITGLHAHTMSTLSQGFMPTFLWVPEEHPEEQYADIHEQAKVSDAQPSMISLDISDADIVVTPQIWGGV